MVTREQREAHKALVRAAPAMPETLPQPTRRINPVDAVFPHVRVLYDTEPNFRAATGSLSPDDSPSGRVCFDDAEAAKMVKERARDVEDTFVNSLKLARISKLIKFCLNRCQLGRRQRLVEARNNLLGSAQPAE